MNNKKFVVLVITIIFIGATGILASCNKQRDEEIILQEDSTDKTKSKEASQKKQNTKEKSSDTDEQKVAYVHVCGQVKRPDVYELAADSRVVDAVKIAGGFTKKADTSALNLARVIVDGEQILIPSKTTAGKGQTSSVVSSDQKVDNTGSVKSSKASNNSQKINLNTATKEQFMMLPGIGEAKATSILQYREEHGLFKKVDEIMSIEGIKKGVYGKIKDLITVQ